MTLVDVIGCGEQGHDDRERWSSWWRPASGDVEALRDLESKRLLKLEHGAGGDVRIAGISSCGRARLPSGLMLDIRPKISAIRLVRWLVYTGTIPPLEGWEEDDGAISSGGAVLDVIARLFTRELTRVTRFHRRAGYVSMAAQTSAVRGRVEVKRLGKVADRLPSLPCTFRARTMDTLANRVLARALDATRALSTMRDREGTWRGELEWLAREWRDIEREVGHLGGSIQASLERPPIGYRAALRLARLMLLGGALDDERGEGGDLFLIDMSRVWEVGLRRMFDRWARGHGHRVATSSERWRPWSDSPDTERARGLAVDAMVYAGRPIILDAKYKRDYGRESREDRFQMAAYSMAFGARAAILVYPTAAQQGRIRLLLRTAVPGSLPSEVHAADLPMALGPADCEAELERLFSALVTERDERSSSSTPVDALGLSH